MQNLDLFVGGVDSGDTSYLKDYYAIGTGEPPEDSQQDYTLISASESNGVTMVHCKRRLNTQDVKDLLIQPGDPVYIAWAYHTSSDDLQYHSNHRGYSSQMHVLVPVVTTAYKHEIYLRHDRARARTGSISFLERTAKMKSFNFFALVFRIFVLFFATADALNHLTLGNGIFNVTWNYLSASQEIEFEVRAKTTGYVSLGLTKTNSGMQNLDLFVGGVDSGGTSYLKDNYAIGKGEPPQDSQQDYTLISASESNGVTMVHCKRRLNTQDVKDLLIQPGDKVYFAWATHTSSDTLAYHTARGYSPQVHELVPLPQTTTPPPTTAPTTAPITAPTTAPTTAPITAPATAPTTAPTTAPVTAPTTAPTTAPITAPATAPTTAPTTAPANATNTAPNTSPTIAPSNVYNKQLSFNNGDYLVFWKFDSNTNELFFKLVVKATGWVGLGFSQQNSGMANLDIVVANVSAGQGFIGDYYARGTFTPSRDSSQDWHLISAKEDGVNTTVEFKRKLDTEDANDQQFKTGESYFLAWAYHSSSDDFTQHTQRGYSQNVDLVVAADAGSTTTARPSPETTSTQKPIPTTAATVTQCSLLLMMISFLASFLLK
ncbi:uncharacterized protein LOC116299842 [Actinia tenebrosa]|uniref:Uncharacterized protein LOC116299842 n=1 Tax=Actinia tenebrosa TaxID=6105 RepID=A0A6P8I8N3_ACTTE|nr:uncharacterized protein LOC116299842 [Actinia tenebrosa]